MTIFSGVRAETKTERTIKAESVNLQEGFKRVTFTISAIAFAVSILLLRPYDLRWAGVSFAVPWVIFGTITYITRNITKYCGRYKKAVLAMLWILCIPASIAVWHFHTEFTDLDLSVSTWYDLLWVLPLLALCGVGIVWGSLAVVCIVIGGTLVWVIQGFTSNNKPTKRESYIEFSSPIRSRVPSEHLKDRVREPLNSTAQPCDGPQHIHLT